MASGQKTAQDAYVQIEDSGGTLRTVKDDFSTSTWTEAAETPEATGYGDQNRQFLPNGLRTIDFSFDGFFNDTATTGIETVLSGLGPGGSTVVVWGPAGSTSGYRKYTACMTLTNYEISAPVDGVIGISAAFVMRAGSVTHGTF